MKSIGLTGLLGSLLLLCLAPSGCKSAPPEETPGNTPEAQPEETEYTETELTLIIDAEYNLPIGYGSTWKCPVRSVVAGELPDEEIGLRTRMNEAAYNGYFGEITDYKALEIDFERLPEMPGALSGFKAEDGSIWEIKTVRSAKYKLPWAYEGRYEVSWVAVPNDTGSISGIGELVLDKGGYTFRPTANRIIPEAATTRLPFIGEPRGEYSISYFRDMKDGDVLSGVDDNTVLATVKFAGESRKTAPDIRGSEFFIRCDTENGRLYFSSATDELELWSVGKGWEE